MKIQFNPHYYAGIGARKTPDNICNIFEMLSGVLCELGWVLRTGEAVGADSAFLRGVNNQLYKEIYSPCEQYCNEQSYRLAAKFHPRWDFLTTPQKRLISRNGHQILGKDLKSPVDFIVCWTESGRVIGGTGQSLRIAESYNIPVFNFGNDPIKKMIDLIDFVNKE